MAQVLVTGASGFIGSHVVRRLATDGHQILACGRDPTRLQADGETVRTITADLACDALHGLVARCQVLVHCAALSAPWGRPADFWRANVTATERLLQAALAHGVRRFIHLGSPSIYFRFDDQFDVGEQFTPPSRWITEYARSKWESECRVRSASGKGMQTLILRPRAVYGEGDRAIVPRLLAVAARGWFPLVHGGRALIDVTHVDNLAELIARLHRCRPAGRWARLQRQQWQSGARGRAAADPVRPVRAPGQADPGAACTGPGAGLAVRAHRPAASRPARAAPEPLRHRCAWLFADPGHHPRARRTRLPAAAGHRPRPCPPGTLAAGT